MAYKPFYIRKQAEGAATYDSSKRWGIYCSGFPFQVIGEAKDLPSRSWYDEHGDDEYIPDTLWIKSYEIEVEFACKGTPKTAKQNIDDFFAYLTGRDTDNGGKTYGSRLEIYDTYTLIGRQDCRYMSFDPTAHTREVVVGDGKTEETCVTFKVKFKVNNPNDSIILSVT